ncbi:MAG: DUF6550 family protein [Christensenellaceae bacterium]
MTQNAQNVRISILMTGVKPVLPESGTLAPPILDVAPEPKVIAKLEEPHAPEQPPAAQEQITSPPSAGPRMLNTRIVDRQKQMYFLNFGWIEGNDTPNEGVYADNMYENGNKVWSMGGGTFVDGDSDINKMVSNVRRGKVGRSCGDINMIVDIVD